MTRGKEEVGDSWAMGQGHQDPRQEPRSIAWGGETGQTTGQGVPKGPEGCQGTGRGQGLGSGVHHHPGLLEVGRDTPPSPDGATAQKASAYSSVNWAVEMGCP